jgi:PIN domain nuclease of toxin-antitoxin system
MPLMHAQYGMNYLLDTHTALWALEDKTHLSGKAQAIIDDVSQHLLISVISAWEIAIKISVGKLNFTGGSRVFLEKMRKNGIDILNIEKAYINIIESLPFHHRDPFDRMLVATAIAENLTILTADEDIRKYNVTVVW